MEICYLALDDNTLYKAYYSNLRNYTKKQDKRKQKFKLISEIVIQEKKITLTKKKLYFLEP